MKSLSKLMSRASLGLKARRSSAELKKRSSAELKGKSSKGRVVEGKVPLHVYDRTDGDATDVPFTPNSSTPYAVDNSVVCGQAVLKVKNNDPNNYYAPYFAGKKRTFEIMVQGKLKEVTPDDIIYLGIQTDGPIKISGFFTRAAAKVVLALVDSTSPTAHCTLGNDSEIGHLVVPLASYCDRFIATPPGETPPTLGIDEWPEEFGKGRRAPLNCYNTEDTYSFSLHSMYVDLYEWKLVNLPGISTMPLDKFIKGQKLYFVGYVIPKSHHGPHTEKVKKYLFKFELDNDLRTSQ